MINSQIKRNSRKTAQRAEFILQELLRSGSVPVEDLTQQLQVDASTIYGDAHADH